MAENFNRNSEIDRLYLPRRNGGRGLKNVKTLYESRIISISQHLKLNRERNKYLREVVAHEEDKIIRVAHELLNKHNIANENKSPEYLSKIFTEKLNENDFMSKPLHGYITKTTLESQEIDKKLSLSWTTSKYITSHFESYAEETKHKIQLFTPITNVDFARVVLKMFSMFYAAVQKCQADTTYH